MVSVKKPSLLLTRSAPPVGRSPDSFSSSCHGRRAGPRSSCRSSAWPATPERSRYCRLGRADLHWCCRAPRSERPFRYRRLGKWRLRHCHPCFAYRQQCWECNFRCASRGCYRSARRNSTHPPPRGSWSGWGVRPQSSSWPGWHAARTSLSTARSGLLTICENEWFSIMTTKTWSRCGMPVELAHLDIAFHGLGGRAGKKGGHEQRRCEQPENVSHHGALPIWIASIEMQPLQASARFRNPSRAGCGILM